MLTGTEITVKPMGPAERRLRRLLADLNDDGEQVPCHERTEWIADDQESRAYAVGHCRLCPVIAACSDAADELQPRAGVWAGVDRGTRTRQARTLATTR